MQACAGDFHGLCQKKNPPELPPGDAAIEKVAIRLVVLAAADHQLMPFRRDIQLFRLETRHGDRDAQIGACAMQIFDVEGGVAAAAARQRSKHLAGHIKRVESEIYACHLHFL